MTSSGSGTIIQEGSPTKRSRKDGKEDNENLNINKSVGRGTNPYLQHYASFPSGTEDGPSPYYSNHPTPRRAPGQYPSNYPYYCQTTQEDNNDKEGGRENSGGSHQSSTSSRWQSGSGPISQYRRSPHNYMSSVVFHPVKVRSSSSSSSIGKPGRDNLCNEKDKGRGSYRCGKCGVPKKGHICPYQPKLKRREDEPPPELRNAATQVEMDEFLVVRRLNLEIQGFPESYTVEPIGDVGTEIHSSASHAGVSLSRPSSFSGIIGSFQIGQKYGSRLSHTCNMNLDAGSRSMPLNNSSCTVQNMTLPLQSNKVEENIKLRS